MVYFSINLLFKKIELLSLLNAHIIAEKLASMTTDAKLIYYNKRFDKHGNQIELTNDQIIVAATTRATRKKDSQENGTNGIDTISTQDAGKDDTFDCVHLGYFMRYDMKDSFFFLLSAVRQWELDKSSSFTFARKQHALLSGLFQGFRLLIVAEQGRLELLLN